MGVLRGSKGVLSATWNTIAEDDDGGTGQHGGTKALRLCVRDQEMAHKVWLAHIQDPCISGLNLLALWGTRVDVPGSP